MSSNPQPPKHIAYEVIRKFIQTNVGYDGGHLMDVQAEELTILLSDAGLLRDEVDGVVCRCAPSPSAAPAQTEDALVSAVAEGLRDFKFEVGPNTLEMLKVGQAVYLTPEERHQIAHAVVNAYQQVVRGE